MWLGREETHWLQRFFNFPEKHGEKQSQKTEEHLLSPTLTKPDRKALRTAIKDMNCPTPQIGKNADEGAWQTSHSIANSWKKSGNSSLIDYISLDMVFFNTINSIKKGKGKRPRGRKRIMMLDSIKGREPYQRMKERAQDRQGWSDYQIWNLLNSSTLQRETVS